MNTPQQSVAGNTISASIVSTRTSSAGAITPITLVQNSVVQITINAGMVITGIVPGATTVDINQVLTGNVITLPPVQVNGTPISSVINVNFQNGDGIDVTNPSGANIKFTWNPATLTTEILGFANGGTGLSTAADDTVMVSNGTAWQAKAVPNCTDTGGQHLNYTAASNAFSCGTTDLNVGTVTSVSFTGGLISVGTPTTTPALTVAGTSGGIPYFSGASTWASSAALTANLPVIGGGAGTAPSVGTVSGNTTQFVTTTGTQTSNAVVKIDANGNHIADSNLSDNGTTVAVTGQVTISGLTSTGSATGKKVVCVDTGTGQLYASSTGTDCTN